MCGKNLRIFLNQSCPFGHNHVTFLQATLYNVFLSVVQREDRHLSRFGFTFLVHLIHVHLVLDFKSGFLRNHQHIVLGIRQYQRGRTSIA